MTEATRLHPKLTDQHLIAIAKIAINVSQIESLLDNILGVLLYRHDLFSKNLIEKSNGARVVEMAFNLLLDTYPENDKETRTLFFEIKEIRTYRHELLHWSWQINQDHGEETEIAVYQQGREWLRPEGNIPRTKQVTARDIDAVNERARKCKNQLLSLLFLAMRDVSDETKNVADKPAQ